LFDEPQDRKFAIRSAFNIVIAGQRRPHSHPHRSIYSVTLPSNGAQPPL